MKFEDYGLIGDLRTTGVSQCYRKGTLIPETDFETDSGVARVIDFMPLRNGRARQLVRIIEGLHGEVPMRMEFTARLDYGSLVPWVERTTEGILALGGANAPHLSTTAAMSADHRMTLADVNGWSVQAASRHRPFCRRIEVPSC